MTERCHGVPSVQDFHPDIFVVEENFAVRGDQKFGQPIEARCIARTIGSGERVNLYAFDLQVNAIDCDKALELFDEVSGLSRRCLLLGQTPWEPSGFCSAVTGSCFI